MSDIPDKRFISVARYRQAYGYSPITENFLSFDEAAAASMESRIKARVMYDPELNEPRPCECHRRGSKKRCQEGSRCFTRMAGFACPKSCDRAYPDRPCMNQDFTREKFKRVVQIRPHRDVDKGLGLFAKTDIKSHTFIGEVCGVLRMGNELDNSYCFEIEDYHFRRPRDQMLFLDASDSGNEWRYVNTSCFPNAILRTVAVGTAFRIGVVTSKFIPKDEEITVYYTEKMLRFINNHDCILKNCSIRYRRDGVQIPQEEAVPDRSKSRGKGPTENIREELTDSKSSRVFFEQTGLGPIQGIGTKIAGCRRAGRGRRQHLQNEKR